MDPVEEDDGDHYIRVFGESGQTLLCLVHVEREILAINAYALLITALELLESKGCEPMNPDLLCLKDTNGHLIPSTTLVRVGRTVHLCSNKERTATTTAGTILNSFDEQNSCFVTVEDAVWPGGVDVAVPYPETDHNGILQYCMQFLGLADDNYGLKRHRQSGQLVMTAPLPNPTTTRKNNLTKKLVKLPMDPLDDLSNSYIAVLLPNGTRKEIPIPGKLGCPVRYVLDALRPREYDNREVEWLDTHELIDVNARTRSATTHPIAGNVYLLVEMEKESQPLKRSKSND